MSGLCVVGLQWGDEAKGKLVDLLTPKHDIVVRYQGGANAGHTIVHGENVYVLHHIPSGILNPGVVNVVTPGVVLNPPTMLKEIESLVTRGIDVGENLLLSERLHVVFPWHLEEDRLIHEMIKGDDNIGTTLRGIGPCYQDKIGRTHAIRLGDFYRTGFKEKIESIVEAKRSRLGVFQTNGSAINLDAAAIVKEFAEYGEQLRPYVTDTTNYLLDAVEQGKSVLFEGAQGALLDIDHGTFPFVTSSNSSGVGISSGSGVPSKWIDQIIGVIKSYNTRVGGGPFPTELHDDTGEHIRKVGNEYGSTTGRPRRCGWFDAVATRYSARLSGVNELALMMLDVLSHLPEIKIGVGYELNGESTDRFLGHADDLRQCRPTYETVPGWETDITEVRQYEDLPINARKYVERLEEILGFPIRFISVGPDREQTIRREF